MDPIEERGPWIAGQPVRGRPIAEVRSPWHGRAVSRVGQGSAEDVERALAIAAAARSRLAALSTWERRAVLQGMVAGLQRRARELAELICAEAGKPIKAAGVEVQRAIETFTLAASELASFGGELVPIDLDPASRGYRCEVHHVPAGVVVGVVPFNFPLNLGAHKVAPAMAVGAPIIIKPPPQAPSAQLILAELAHQAGADPGALQVVPCDNALAEQLATDDRVRVLSFTGSARVGWALKQKAPGRVLLELGGNAAAVVCADADLDWAAERCAVGGFGYGGQVCIKVQRLYVERAVYEPFVARLVARARALAVGDPSAEATIVGPLIDDAAAARVEAWIGEAVAGGARLLTGGTRAGRVVDPTVLADAPRTARVCTEEVFGPVVTVAAMDDFDTALSHVNDSAYGLQAGIFTNDLRRVQRAFRTLEVGGLIVNDYPTFRSDNYPYGGVKGSGLGREGVRYAMRELTEQRVLVTRG